MAADRPAQQDAKPDKQAERDAAADIVLLADLAHRWGIGGRAD
jgi:hypothetical protein